MNYKKAQDLKVQQELTHFGVLGMHWGVRKGGSTSSRSSTSSSAPKMKKGYKTPEQYKSVLLSNDVAGIAASKQLSAGKNSKFYKTELNKLRKERISILKARDAQHLATRTKEDAEFENSFKKLAGDGLNEAVAKPTVMNKITKYMEKIPQLDDPQLRGAKQSVIIADVVSADMRTNTKMYNPSHTMCIQADPVGDGLVTVSLNYVEDLYVRENG